MKLKRTLLCARLRSLRKYFRVSFYHFAIHFPDALPRLLGGNPGYLTAVIFCDVNLLHSQRVCFRDRIPFNKITRVEYVEETNHWSDDYPVWQISIDYLYYCSHTVLFSEKYAVVSYYSTENRPYDDHFTLSLDD